MPTVLDVVEFGAIPPPPPPPRLEALASLLSGEEGVALEVDHRDGPSSNRVAVQERIQSSHRIRELASTLVRYRSIGVLNSAYQPPVHVRAAEFHRTAHAMCWELSGKFVEPPFVIEVAGYNSVFQILIERASMRDGLMLTPLPREVVRVRRRWGRRASAPKGTKATVSLQEPNERTLRDRNLRDISFSGVSFRTDSDDEALRPGSKLARIQITPPGDDQPIEFTGEVSFVARDADGVHDLCGARVTPISDRDGARWREFVSRTLYPKTRMGTEWSDAIWQLYQDAGYFSLSGKDPVQFGELARTFARNVERILATPSLGCVVAWPIGAGPRVLATIAMVKVFAGSWFVYQLAKVRGDAPDGTSSRQVLRDVHLHAYEHAQQDPSLRWLIGYPQVKEVWSRAVHHDLPRRFTTAGLAHVQRFRALEVACDSAHPALAEDITVGPATPAEIEAFLQHLANLRPRPYCEALDLTPEHIDLAENKRLWTSARLSRDRALHVARHEGRAIAAAILEDAEEGMHLFRLLDLVRPYPLTPHGDLAARAMDALVAGAKSWFRAKGKPAFCCMLEDDAWLTPAMRQSMIDMGLADMTILSARLLPEMLEHLVEVTAPRDKPGDKPALERASAARSSAQFGH